MKSSLLFRVVLTVTTLAIFVAVSSASEGKKAWDFNTDWSYANANVIRSHFESIYFNHCRLLLEAEKRLTAGGDQPVVLEDLKSLPGTNAVVISRSDGKEGHQLPKDAVNMKDFTEKLFNPYDKSVLKKYKEFKLDAKRQPKISKSPMMHRTVGGKVSFVGFSVDKDRYDLLTRILWQDSTAGISAAISLVLDPDWLVRQIPTVMDSLFRENSQLLFWAPSSRNNLVDQSIGIIHEGDTLWWKGNKDVEVGNIQVMWPILAIKIHSYIHWK